MPANFIPREIIVEGFGNEFSTGPLDTPIVLRHDFNHSLGVSAFYGCNAILNIYPGNNKLYYDNHVVTIPSGCYEVDEIGEFIKSDIERQSKQKGVTLTKRSEPDFKLTANNNTLKCEIKSIYTIDFTKADNIGAMLGFSPQKLKPNHVHVSNKDVEITKTSAIFVETNITEGAYRNNVPCHSIYHIPVSVAPGYNLEDNRIQVRHFPIRVSEIREIAIRLVDFNGDLINISNDTRTIVCLELKSEV